MSFVSRHDNFPQFSISVPMIIFMVGVFFSTLCFFQKAIAAEIHAPLESMRIELSTADAPVNVTLKQWFCSAFDDQEDRLNVHARVLSLTKESVKDRVDPNTPADPCIKYFIYARNNWAYAKVDDYFSSIIKSELRQSRIMKQLDAHPGETRVYRKKNCYTEQDVKAFIRQVGNGVTDEMIKIMNKLRAYPYDFTEDDFREAGWFTQPPKKFKNTQFKHHTIVISVFRDSKKKKGANQGNPKEKKPLPPPPPSIDENSDGQTDEKTTSQASFQCSFDGEWTSSWGDMIFHQNGPSVKATYTHDTGKIDGTVSGSKLTGYWTEAPTYNIHSHDGGDVKFTLSDDCTSFSGQWRYGTHGDWLGAWSAKRKAGSKITKTIKQPVVKKNPQETLQDQLEKVDALNGELSSLRRQWKIYSDQITEQRAKGNDVTQLKQNLMHIHVKRQQARKQLIAANKKYGTYSEIQKKIRALQAAPKSSSSSNANSVNHAYNANAFPGVPGFSHGGLSGSGKGANSKAGKTQTGSGTSTIPLSGSSVRKHAPLAGTRLAVSARWAAYKVKKISHRTGQLPEINVVKISFKKSASRAALIVKSYPVSLVQMMDGTILWSVNWQNSEIEEKRMVSQPDEIFKLNQAAEQRKSGSVSEKELDTLIGNMLGPKASKKK
ncbi:MAG: hypothetical protein R8K53_01915 [Mariprofundaceae bacterium]